MKKQRKAVCTVCGMHRPIAYRGDTGPVCERCHGTETGQLPPEQIELQEQTER